MKKTTANICASVYEGEFTLDLSCVDVEKCRFALCSLMPPDGSEECTYREHGSCLSPDAKHAALDLLKNRLTRELRQLRDDLDV